MTTIAPNVKPVTLTAGRLPSWTTGIVLTVALLLSATLFFATGSPGFIRILLVGALIFAAVMMAASLAVEGGRKAKDRLATITVTAAFGLALLPLVSLVISVIGKGSARFDLQFFTYSMRNVVGEGGGAVHAIIGTLWVTGIATLISVPIGILAAIYLVEYGTGSLARSITFFVDVMTGIPSIVAGLFAYALFVLFFGPGTKSGIAGAVALTVLMIPVVVRSIEELLKIVPNELREASYALGVPKWLTIVKVVLPTAAGRHRHRRDARGGPGDRRDRAAADRGRLHAEPEQQPPQRPDDDPAGVRLPVLRRPGQPGLGVPGPGLGRCTHPDPDRHDPEPRGASDRGEVRPQSRTLSEKRKATTMSKRIEVNDLNVYYGDFKAVEDVSLTVEPRTVMAFIGPSGCGKSTFLRTLNRMHEVIPKAYVEGSVKLDGDDLYGPGVDPVRVRRQVGMVFQRPNPFPTMSIGDNVLAGVRLNNQRMSTSKSKELLEGSLRSANLWNEVKDRLDKPGSGLSGGQQQRLCIARAIAVQPEVILMDEPCSALDPISTLAIEDLIGELKESYTVVIVTHNMQQAARVSDMTAFFNLSAQGKPGRLIEMGTTDKIFSNPDAEGHRGLHQRPLRLIRCRTARTSPDDREPT